MTQVKVPPSKLVDPKQIIQLESLDFSKFDDPKTRVHLAKQLESALTTRGFVSVKNYGIDEAEIEHLRKVAKDICSYPHEEQGQYLAGSWFSDTEDRSVLKGAEISPGYKPRGYWLMQNGTRDNIVFYNFNELVQPTFGKDEFYFPPPARPHLSNIQSYYNHVHTQVLRKLCILTDIALELPEGTTYDLLYKVVPGNKEELGNGVGRLMLYFPQPKEVDAKNDGKWLRGHSDLGGFTFITSQPILLLQIRDYWTGEWLYVGHEPGALIVNVGDSMEFVTAGYFKLSIHRVVAPPADQAAYERLVLIYFSQMRRLCILDPEQLQSPKLDRLQVVAPKEWVKITNGKWQDQKGALFGQKAVNDSKGDEPNLVLVYGRLHERWHQVDKEFTLENARKTHHVIELSV